MWTNFSNSVAFRKKSKHAYYIVILKGDTYKFQIVEYYPSYKGDTQGDTFVPEYIFLLNFLNWGSVDGKLL